MLDLATGEMVEKALSHERKEEARAHAGEEPVAGSGAEPGRATKAEAVERGGKKAAGVAAAVALGQPAAQRLMTHPGVGPVTALAFTLTMGPAERFQRGKQIASYLGLIPSEYSSGGRNQRLGHISKQGSSFLRGLLVEAAQSAVRHEPETRRAYQ